MEHILLLKINKEKLDNLKFNSDEEIYDFLDEHSEAIYDFGAHLNIDFDSLNSRLSTSDNDYYIIDKNYLRSIIRLYQNEINSYFHRLFKKNDKEEILKLIRDEYLFWNNQDLANHSFNYRFTPDKSKNIFRLLNILETFDFDNDYLLLSQ